MAGIVGIVEMTVKAVVGMAVVGKVVVGKAAIGMVVTAVVGTAVVGTAVVGKVGTAKEALLVLFVIRLQCLRVNVLQFAYDFHWLLF